MLTILMILGIPPEHGTSRQWIGCGF